ncbi:hypothetical protein Clacol_006731 [Clathrus columnatus]|uniref:6-phosphofructo-2-kinase domain-containing protein n=1 Tax=Clathrus columnatus TaxID=1419009 RepID=A0AAV5AII4_9AGAM|nr:hypothetical protein Clacol_006731 [Clathrus columnatus]
MASINIGPYSTSPTDEDKLVRVSTELLKVTSDAKTKAIPAHSSSKPFFGAGGMMLKQFDEHHALSRKHSTDLATAAPTPPRSVVGIGGKGRAVITSGDPIIKNLTIEKKVAKPDYSEAKIVVAMWLEYEVKVFNVGQLRRSRAKAKREQSGIKEDHGAEYFSHDNQEATRLRDKLAEDSLEMLIQWLKEGGNVGIHDATNSTRDRRAKISNRVAKEKGCVVIFLESICDDPAVIAANVALKVSSGDPDYQNVSREEAERDFVERIRKYERIYETITEPNLSYLRITNVGDQVTLCNIHGYLQSRIAFYLMNLHIKPRSIFFSRVRHGESIYNVLGKIGGDSSLSEKGREYSEALPKLIHDNIDHARLTVWTSTLQRTIETAQHLDFPKLTWKALDELDAGVCDGMTYEEIEVKKNILSTIGPAAYPTYRASKGGESYRDVVIRLEPIIMELERQENILIIGHQAILRCLYAYFHNLPQIDLPYIKIPLHTVIKLTPKAYGCDEERSVFIVSFAFYVVC